MISGPAEMCKNVPLGGNFATHFHYFILFFCMFVLPSVSHKFGIMTVEPLGQVGFVNKLGRARNDVHEFISGILSHGWLHFFAVLWGG